MNAPTEQLPHPGRIYPTPPTPAHPADSGPSFTADPGPTHLVRLVRVDRHDDHRGTLDCADFAGLEFAAVRAFVVTGTPGSVRGGHAHRRGRQLLMLSAGEVVLDLVADGVHRQLHLPADARAVLVEPGVWAQQTYLGPASVLTVLCDTPYDPDDYVAERPDELDAHGVHGALAHAPQPQARASQTQAPPGQPSQTP